MADEETSKLFGLLKASSVGETVSLRTLERNYTSEFGSLSDDFEKLGLTLTDDNLISFLKDNGSVEITKRGRDYFVKFESCKEEQELKEMIDRNISKNKKKPFNKGDKNMVEKETKNFFEEFFNFEQVIDAETSSIVRSNASSYYENLRKKKEMEKMINDNNCEPNVRFGENYVYQFDNIDENFDEIDEHYENLAEEDGANNEEENECESGENKDENVETSDKIIRESDFRSFGEDELTNTIMCYNKTPELRREFRQMLSNSLDVLDVMEKMVESWEKSKEKDVV